ncbi:LANO_0H06282g1_1 [Lachancea nothofagi CBS 11611]|uniref:LANO_0H06282g1_1 n=1 Tax=Lachancea nothofagi CBS 11611 TaxID=1266666 RepID=A0A1G4KLM3_9SACH|nr:LANO_0H06282g1_1 [Lachancea nothofagi CBS 11611]
MDFLNDLSATPYLAMANSLMLLATPVVSPAVSSPIGVGQSGSSLTRFWSRPKFVGPSTKTALLFGGAQALGSWIIYDGDLESGSGFLGAWSALYLIVGGRGSVKALRYGRVWPLALSTLALANTAFYTKRFVSGGFK